MEWTRADQRRYDNTDDDCEEIDEDTIDEAAHLWIEENADSPPDDLLNWVIENKWDEICGIAEERLSDG